MLMIDQMEKHKILVDHELSATFNVCQMNEVKLHKKT